jgi:hypothetical protein
MNTTMKIMLGGAVLCVLFLMTTCGVVLSFNNGAVEQEAGIKAQYLANQAVYDKVWKSVAQTANVATAHSDKFKSIIVEAIEGRYAKDDGLLFKSITEANGSALPVELYAKVQQIIESGQSEFTANQTSLLARKQTYETFLGRFPNNVMASVLGYPRIDLDKYGIVTSNRTDEAFATKKDEPLLPFGTAEQR